MLDFHSVAVRVTAAFATESALRIKDELRLMRRASNDWANDDDDDRRSEERRRKFEHSLQEDYLRHVNNVADLYHVQFL